MNQILDFTYVALGDVSPDDNWLLLAAFYYLVEGWTKYVAAQELFLVVFWFLRELFNYILILCYDTGSLQLLGVSVQNYMFCIE